MHIQQGLQAISTVKPAKYSSTAPPARKPKPPRWRVVGTRAQGQFAQATTPGVPTVAVAQAITACYKHICASEPENVCTLLADSPTK